jgi:hypothetical protein
MTESPTFLAPGQRYAEMGARDWCTERQLIVVLVGPDPDGIVEPAADFEAAVAAGILRPVAGAVEATPAGSLHAGGIPVPDAVAATVLFRLAQVWLPLALGALALLPAAERVRVSGPRAVPESRQEASSR